MLCDKVGNESDTTTLGFVEAFDEWETNSSWLHATFETGTQTLDESVWNDKNENVSAISGVTDIWNSNLWQVFI